MLAALRKEVQKRWLCLTKPVTLGARVILVQDGAVLLVEHTYLEQWYLPGGKVECGETLEQAVRREAAEEVGAELGELRLVGVYDNFTEPKSDHIAIFACEAFTLERKRSREIRRAVFFPLSDLPDDVSPATRRRIDDYLSGAPDTSAPASGVAVVGPW